MIYVLLFFWIVSALLTTQTQRLVRIVIYLSIFSTISAVCFFVLGAPDVAMAEIAISSFSTIFLIVCFEKYFVLVADASAQPPAPDRLAVKLKKIAFPACFTVFLLAMFIYFIPEGTANAYLKDLYLAGFRNDIGGENTVSAIYLGYRMYDTLFEALMLLISVVAIAHMSMHRESDVTVEHLENVSKPGAVDFYTIRIICPAMLLFGLYLVLNGHISPGGGFQGGVAVTSFFICKYLIHRDYNMRLGSIIVMEKMVFAGLALLAVFFIFIGTYVHMPRYRVPYLIMVNLLIAIKIACGFTIVFFRYIAFERKDRVD
jgi:multicomponent Na+:H+ antiporter subunit B